MAPGWIHLHPWILALEPSYLVHSADCEDEPNSEGVSVICPCDRAGFDAWDPCGLMVVFGDGYRVCE